MRGVLYVYIIYTTNDIRHYAYFTLMSEINF